MKTAVMWRAAVASDPGLMRTGNEDRVFADEGAGIFLVVDGIGGQPAGEIAAETAVAAISRHLAAMDCPVEECIRRAIAAANNEIYQLAESNADWRGMSCVLTVAVAHDDRITVGHVGDTRLYLAWDGKLRKLTSDHSPVGECEDQGELTEEEAMTHPGRNQVFRDVGSRPREAGDDGFIEVRGFPFHADAAFLLCSDGLSDMLSSAEISAIIETYDGDAEAVARRLVEEANHAGGKDNVSVIFVAGPEFAGRESQAKREARARHTITRERSGRPRWKSFVSHMIWLIAGVVLGSLLWAGLYRIVQRPAAARAVEAAARPAAATIVSASDPRAIAKALSVAQPGDTIVAPPGEYLGPIELKDGVNLISATPGGAIVRVDPAAVADAGIAFTARGLRSGRLSGFRVVGDGKSPLATGVVLDDASLEIDDMDVAGARDCGIRIEAGSASVLRANFIHGNAGCGVSVRGAGSPRLAGNRISDNGALGVEIHAPAAPALDNNIITNNGQGSFSSATAAIEEEIRRKNITDGAPRRPPK